MKRTIIITGGNTGLGYSCARYIAGSSNDYTIMIACRNVQKGNDAAEKLKEKTGNPNIYVLELDLASLTVMLGTVIALVLPKFKNMQKLTDNLNRVARENLTGIRVVWPDQYLDNPIYKSLLNLLSRCDEYMLSVLLATKQNTISDIIFTSFAFFLVVYNNTF